MRTHVLSRWSPRGPSPRCLSPCWAALQPQPQFPMPRSKACRCPVWLVRDGKREPLALGAQLRNGDRIESGPGARVLLRLADGSTVKLGENARFTLDGMTRKRDGAGAVHARLWVCWRAPSASPPLRSTTSAAQRDVEVRFTDRHGGHSRHRHVGQIDRRPRHRRADRRQDHADARRRGAGARWTRHAPCTRRRAMRRPLPIEPITAEQLGCYAAETEIAPGQGALGKGGRWRVYAARTTQPGRGARRCTIGCGKPAIRPPSIRCWQRARPSTAVRIGGLLSESDGTVVAVKLKAELGLQDVSVSLN